MTTQTLLGGSRFEIIWWPSTRIIEGKVPTPGWVRTSPVSALHTEEFGRLTVTVTNTKETSRLQQWKSIMWINLETKDLLKLPWNVKCGGLFAQKPLAPGGTFPRDLRSFDIRFEFESDDSDSIRFQNDADSKFSNQPHLPTYSYHEPRSL